MNNQPLVSIILTCYNHEKFILSAVESCLNQTYQNIEIIAVDDHSIDRTAILLSKVTDPRFKLYKTLANEGPSRAFNLGVENSKGALIAFMSGDDICYPERIAEQVTAWQNNTNLGTDSIIFSHVIFINKNNQEFSLSNKSPDYFNVKQLSRSDYFKKFFKTGNFLCAPTALVSRKLFHDCGGLDPVLIQLQDFDLWIKAIKRVPFTILEKPLIKYRIHNNNLSKPDLLSSNASQNELFLIYKDFFTNAPYQLIIDAFKEDLQNLDLENSLIRSIEIALLLYKSPVLSSRVSGFEAIANLLRHSDSRKLLIECYGFSEIYFWRNHKTQPLFFFSVITDKLITLIYRIGQNPRLFSIARGFYRLLKRVYQLKKKLKFIDLSGLVTLSTPNIVNRLMLSYYQQILISSNNKLHADQMANAGMICLEKNQNNNALTLAQRAFLFAPKTLKAKPQLVRLLRESLSEHSLAQSAFLNSLDYQELNNSQKISYLMKVMEFEEWSSSYGGLRTVIEPPKNYTFNLPQIFQHTYNLEHITLFGPESCSWELENVAILPGFTVSSFDQNSLFLYEKAAHPRFGGVSGLWQYYSKYNKESNRVSYTAHINNRSSLDRAYLVSGRCSSNYYHFLIEYLFKFYELDMLSSDIKTPIILSRNMPTQHFQLFDLLNSGRYPVVLMGNDEILDVKKLIIPSISTYLPDDFNTPFWNYGYISRNHFRYIRRAILSHFEQKSSDEYPSRIFISRINNSGRSLINEKNIAQIAEKAGFKLIYPELLSAREQIAHFMNARYIIAPSGAALTNLLFTSPGTTVLSLTSERNQYFCNFSNIAELAGATFIHVVGDNLLSRNSFVTEEQFAHSPFQINEEIFKKALQTYIGS